MIGFRGDEDTLAGLAALYDTEGVVADVMAHEESALVVAYGADANAARRIAGEAELTETSCRRARTRRWPSSRA